MYIYVYIYVVFRSPKILKGQQHPLTASFDLSEIGLGLLHWDKPFCS